MSGDAEQGAVDWWRYKASRAYQQFNKDARAEDVMRLFWPPEREDMLQVTRPMSKQRRDWIAGFNKARAEDAAMVGSATNA